ncbi:ABC transporter permease [Georgenia sp. Z1491]|uniref:ABC transporter permease n=1 Tax=Georgenia sp. Z1491 TaxID=3416707 RepID=UPI003CF21E4C
MLKMILNRLALMIPVLIAASIFVFVLAKLMPVDPARVLLGDGATDAQVAEVRAELGLDRSWPVQYGSWLWNAVQGDFGDSVYANWPVAELIGDSVGVTISLSIAGIACAVVLGLGLGTIAGLRAGSWADRVISVINALWIAVPNFWVGLLLAILLGVQLGWLPVSGYTEITEDPVEWARSLILPGIALGLNPAAVIARQTRGAVRDMSNSQFVTALRSRGISENRIVNRYIFKNSMVPVVATIGIQVPIIVGGTLVVESVFSQPGLGTELTRAVQRSDPFLLQAGVLIIVVFVLLLNLVVDIVYRGIDPRIRAS